MKLQEVVDSHSTNEVTNTIGRHKIWWFRLACGCEVKRPVGEHSGPPRRLKCVDKRHQ